MRFGLLCGHGQRLDGFKQALIEEGHPPPQHITFQEFLKTPAKFTRLLENIDILRIDSPGGGFDIWSCFANELGMKTENVRDQHGRIYPQYPYVDGTIQSVDRACQMARSFNVYNTVSSAAVKTFMDKSETHSMCWKTKIPIPRALPDVTNFTELKKAMNARDLRSVFMKLRFGSAASGVLAIELFGERVRVRTSVERATHFGQTVLFNSLKLRTYLDQFACQLIDEIAEMGVHVEEWVPKLKLGEQRCDIRLLVIDGVPAHCVVRSALAPITNLHLGNDRHNIETIRKLIPGTIWEEILHIGRVAGTLYPEHFCIGIDIAIHENKEQVFILEINAFGDHLHNVMYNGESPHQYQIRAWEKKLAER